MEEVVQSYLNKARKDKFLLVFDLPPILKPLSRKYERNNKVLIPDAVQFSVFGSLVPEIVVKGSEVRYAGSTLFVSSFNKDSFQPIHVDFKVDNNYNNYFTIWSWLNLLHDQYEGVYNATGITPEDSNFNDYQTNVTLYGLDEFQKKRISFTYTKAFPTSLDEMSYNQQADEGEEIECGFTFLFSQLHVDLLNEV